ncbi:MAG TPA: hypothetical protein VF662_00205 [Allosphingosinicella sp.]|jgi:hypothetical protein
MPEIEPAAANVPAPGRSGWLADASNSRLGTLCLLFAALQCALLIGTTWWTGAVPQMVFGHDVMVLLDGAWKLKWGITPHSDFYSPFGVLTFLVIAVGIDLTGSLVHAIPAATCIVALFALPLALYASFSRLHPLIALAATIVLIATAVAPHELRFGSDVWSYAAIYNRWAYPLFGIAMLIMAVRPSEPAGWKDWADGLIVGSCTLLLIFLKISYGLLAVALIVGFAPIRLRGRRYWFGVLVSGLAWLLAFGFLLDWGFGHLLQDMRIAAGARHGLGPIELLRWGWSLRAELVAMSGLALIWCATGSTVGRAALLRRVIECGWVFGAFAGSAAAILMTNSPLGHLSETPIAELGALVLLGGIVRDLRETGAEAVGPVRPKVLALAGIGLALVVVLPMTGRNVVGVAEAAAAKRAGTTLSPAERFTSGPLEGLQISAFGGDPPLPTTYVGKVMDGLRLLQRTGNAGRTVAALDFANPFNVVRGVQPSETAPTCWQLGFLFSPQSAPPAERVFNGRDVIMVPKRFGDGDQRNLTVMQQLYGSYFSRHYRLAGESEQWRLFVPK